MLIDYGFDRSFSALFYAMPQGFRFIMTIDNGVHAGPAIALATRLGVELIVVDHHLR